MVLVIVFTPLVIFDLITADPIDRISDDIQDPVSEMRTPVVDGPTRDFFVRSPPGPLLAIAKKTGFNAKDSANDLFLADQIAQNHEVAIPTSIVKSGDHHLLLLEL